jgi:2-oxo-4-hydroxy-4-carboxy-5-ureidoimidazoline decarboxylase
MHTSDGPVEVRSQPATEPLDRLTAAELRGCCAADSWVRAVVAAGPHRTLDALLDASDTAVLALDDPGLEQALAAHPRIGERASDGSPADTWSRTEQADALSADADLAARLAEGNRAYERRFDRVFLVRASGRTAAQLYDELQSRLGNDDTTERAVVLHELADIVRLRLTRLAGG